HGSLCPARAHHKRAIRHRISTSHSCTNAWHPINSGNQPPGRLIGGKANMGTALNRHALPYSCIVPFKRVQPDITYRTYDRAAMGLHERSAQHGHLTVDTNLYQWDIRTTSSNIDGEAKKLGNSGRTDNPYGGLW